MSAYRTAIETNYRMIKGENIAENEREAIVGELLGADYYVLPSSIHEVLVLPDNGEMDVKELESMVRDVNAAEVAPHELLSDKVQFYDRASRTLGRKQEKGILGRLAENKKQIQEKAGKEKVAENRRNEPSM